MKDNTGRGVLAKVDIYELWIHKTREIHETRYKKTLFLFRNIKIKAHICVDVFILQRMNVKGTEEIKYNFQIWQTFNSLMNLCS